MRALLMSATDQTAPGADAFPATAAAGGHLGIVSLTHAYGARPVLRDVDLSVAPGEFIAVLGPSGCGKSTLLRAIAGLVRPQAGRILLDGQDITVCPANERSVGTVFQSYALFPHMTCVQNIGYGLRAQGRPRGEIAERVDQMLTTVRMQEHAHRYPAQLSGGQQQRVALARTLAVHPKVLLLDEPFAALDRSLRLDMQIEVKRLQRHFGITTILVTHDQEEALSLADRVVIMDGGRIQQIERPQTVYDRPANAFVAGFVGETNFLPGELCVGRPNGVTFAFGREIAWRLPLARPCAIAGRAVMAVRPEQLVMQAPGPGRLCGSVGMVMPLGPRTIIEIHTELGIAVKVSTPHSHAAETPQPGEPVAVALAEGAIPSIFLPEINPTGEAGHAHIRA